MKRDIPFYSQAWELDRWSELGFANREEATYWERSSCGILCLKMAIDALRSRAGQPLSPSIRDYIRIGLEIKAYNDASGWEHDGLVCLAKHFGVAARRESGLSVEKIIEYMREGAIPLVSVKWGFATEKTLKEKLLFWKKYGGHIAVVTGFETDSDPQTIIVHHTSKRPEGNWIHRDLPLKQFQDSFTGRGILVGV